MTGEPEFAYNQDLWIPFSLGNGYQSSTVLSVDCRMCLFSYLTLMTRLFIGCHLSFFFFFALILYAVFSIYNSCINIIY